jgi:hypothetical protein
MPPVVKLYHGTTERIGRLAIKEGLRPRKLTGKSNWKHFVESHPSLVYLTKAYAPYYALQVVRGKKIAIVEIETNLLDEFKLLPDEDFIEQATRCDKQNKTRIEGKTIAERTEYIRNHLDEFSGFWGTSVEHLGNCAYEGIIPKTAITRLAIIDISKCGEMCFEANEPIITIMNYRLCGTQFRMLTRWFMGETVTMDEWFKTQSVNPSNYLPKKERVSAIKKFSGVLANQEGIQIITP